VIPYYNASLAPLEATSSNGSEPLKTQDLLTINPIRDGHSSHPQHSGDLTFDKLACLRLVCLGLYRSVEAAMFRAQPLVFLLIAVVIAMVPAAVAQTWTVNGSAMCFNYGQTSQCSG